MTNLSQVNEKSIRFFDKSNCNALWQLNIIHFNDFPSRYQKIVLCLLDMETIDHCSTPQYTWLAVPACPAYPSSLSQGQSGQPPCWPAVGSGWKGCRPWASGSPRGKSQGGEVRGREDHSLSLEHLLMITLSPIWLFSYLVSAPENGLIYRLRSSESKVCVACTESQKDSTEPPF